jgi:hypothetical protein
MLLWHVGSGWNKNGLLGSKNVVPGWTVESNRGRCLGRELQVVGGELVGQAFLNDGYGDERVGLLFCNSGHASG